MSPEYAEKGAQMAIMQAALDRFGPFREKENAKDQK